MNSSNFTVGDYQVFPNTQTLTFNDEVHRLQPRVMRLLCFLCEHANTVISRQELVTNVWDDAVISDDAIHRSISILRTTLKDSAKTPKYLQTIPKTGYRIIAPVKFEDKKTDSLNSHKKKKITVVVPIALVVFAAVLLLLKFNLNKEDSRANTVPKIRHLTSHLGLEYAPQIAPVHGNILYSQYLDGWEGTFTISPHPGKAAKQLPLENHYIDSVWSGDGQAVYSHKNTKESCEIVKHFISGLPPQSVGQCITNDNGMFFYMDVSNDDSIIITSERDSNSPRKLYLFNLITGIKSKLFKNPGGVGDYLPKISPDGQWVAFTRAFSANARELMVTPINNSGTVKQLTHDDAFVQDLAWTSDNNLVFISNRDSGNSGFWHVNIKDKSISWLNLLIEGVNRFDIADDDKYLVYQTWYQPFNIYQIDLDLLDPSKHNIMSEGKMLSQSKDINIFPAMSPNDKYITYISNKTGDFGLWIAKSDGSSHRLLVENVYRYSAPEWSPNSEQIAFTKTNNNHGDLCITNLQGNYSCISKSGQDELFATWSKHQNLLYFTKLSADENPEYINVIYDFNTGEVKPSGIESALNVRESKDQDIVYYNEAATSNIYRLNKATTEKQLLINDFYDIYYKSWDLVDNGIYYYSKDKNLCFYDFETNQINVLISIGNIGGYDTTSGLQINQQKNTLTMTLSPMTLNGDIGLVENFADLLPKN